MWCKHPPIVILVTKPLNSCSIRICKSKIFLHPTVHGIVNKKISFLISHTLSLLLTFRPSFFSPLFHISVAQIGMKALGGWDSNRCGPLRVLGLVVLCLHRTIIYNYNFIKKEKENASRYILNMVLTYP